MIKLYNCSCFYQFKHNNKLIAMFRENKKKMKKHMIEVYESRDYEIVYKMLDNFIYQLVTTKIIYIEKTSSKDYINCNGYIVGLSSNST